MLLIGVGLVGASRAAIAAPAAVNLSFCAKTATIRSQFDWNKSAKLGQIQINLNNSNVQIESVKGLNKAVFVVVGCASSAQLLHDLGWGVKRSGENGLAMTLLGVKNLDFSSSFHHKNYAYIDMRMQVPESTAVKIDSDSGNIVASNLSKLSVKSGSGNIMAKNITGLFSASTDSGHIDAQDLGRVELGHVGSGPVRISNVLGDVKAKSLGAGLVNIQAVQGKVVIKSLGTGGVKITQVGGNVTVHKTGTGSLEVNNIGGDFKVKHNGGGKIWYANIKGAVSVAQS